MTSTAALIQIATDFSRGQSMLGIFPTTNFWDSLPNAGQRECIREDRTINLCGQTAWVTQGKVQQKWQDLILPSIERDLTSQEAKIFEPCEGRILPYDVNIYMRGTLERFRPTLVASCMELSAAKVIVKLVKIHLKPHNLGFRYLAVNGPIRLTTGPASSKNSASPPLSACGVPISIRYDADGSHNIKTATIGGCMRVGLKHYGLTAAHVLFADSQNCPEGPTGDHTESLDWCEISSDTSDLDILDDHFTPLPPPASRHTQESRLDYFWRSEAPDFQLSDSDTPLWDLVIPVPELESLELDWLLIPLEAEGLIFENHLHFNGDDIFLSGVAKEGPDDTVILVTGQSGNQLLKASSTVSLVFIPSARKLLRTWSVYHDETTLTQGDSGSWAVSKSGEVYGFLVGTNEGSRVSYVAPMMTTVDAIRRQNPGVEVSFPIRHSMPGPEQRLSSVRRTEQQPRSLEPLHGPNFPRTPMERSAKVATVGSWLSTVLTQSFETAPINELPWFWDRDSEWPAEADMSDTASVGNYGVRFGSDAGENRSSATETAPINKLPGFWDRDSEWPAEDDMSDTASVGTYSVRFGSDAGENRSSATSSMIFSTRDPPRNTTDDHPEPVFHHADLEISDDHLQRVLSFLPQICGTSGDREKLDPKYYKRPDAEKFFGIGRVFGYLSHERVEESTDLGNATYITGSKEGKVTLSRIRRLAVIRECDGYCIAVPIETPSGQGFWKRGLDRGRKAHVLVYGSDTTAAVTKEGKEAIAIHLSGAEKKLDLLSRLEFGQAIIVQWDVKVMNIGKVATDSLSAFIRHAFKTLDDVQLQGNASEGVPGTPDLPHSVSTVEAHTLSRGLGETYVYGHEQGEMERIARRNR